MEGPGGEHDVRVKGNIRSNSADFVRNALLQGLGIALRSVWDVGPEIERGELTVVLPEYAGTSKNAIYAVYSCREFMPSKVNAFIEFLAELYAGDAPWQRQGLDGARFLERATDKAAIRAAAAKSARA